MTTKPKAKPTAKKKATKPKRSTPIPQQRGDQLLNVTVSNLLDLARTRAGRKKVPFELTKEDVRLLASSRHCPVTGLAFVLGASREGNRPHPLAPSLDRIDPARGYVRGNVRLTSWWANCARNNMTDEQFSIMVNAAYHQLRNAIFQ